MSRSHLAVLISLIGAGLSSPEVGLAQGAGAAAPQSASTLARDAAIRSALGLGRDDDREVARTPSTPRAAVRRSTAPAARPGVDNPRWDATALGLDRTAPRDAARDANALSAEDGRVRTILGFGAAPVVAPPLVTARTTPAPRSSVRRVERDEATVVAGPPAVTVSPVEASAPTVSEQQPLEPVATAATTVASETSGSVFEGAGVVALVDRAPPTAWLSPLVELETAGLDGLSLRTNAPQPQPRRPGRTDPPPMIADAPSSASRRGGTGTSASLSLTSDDLARAADRLRTPARDRKDRDDAPDPRGSLLQVVPRADYDPDDSPRRLIAAIVERTRSARVAAEVFRHIAVDILALPERRTDVQAASDMRRHADDPVDAVRPARADDLPMASAISIGAASTDALSPVAADSTVGPPDPVESAHHARSAAAWASVALEASMPEPIAAKAAFVDGLSAMQPATRPYAAPAEPALPALRADAADLVDVSPFERIVAALAACAPPTASLPPPSPLLVRVLDPALPRAAPLPFLPRASWNDAPDDAERRVASARFVALTTPAADGAAEASARAAAESAGSRRPSVWIDVFDPALDLPRRPSRPATGDASPRVVATAGLRIDPLVHRGAADHDFGGTMLATLERFESKRVA